MKILHITLYYSPHIGGIEQVTEDVIEALENHENKVLCFNHEKGDKKDIVNGVEVIRVGCFAKIKSQSLSFHYKKALKSMLNNFKPELIIFHYPNPFASTFLLPILKKNPKIKLITFYHLDIIRQKILGKLFAKNTNSILSRSYKVISTSPNYVEGSKFLSHVKDKIEIIPLAVNPSRLEINDNIKSEANRIRKENFNKTICFALGRHIPYKGMEFLIKAAKQLDDSFSIFIAGNGPLTNGLKKLNGDNKLVTFLGKIDDNTLKSYLLASDIFCFPSITKNEAFGIALAEAMSYAKPCITFTIEGSGVNFVSIKDETGLEVENQNVNQYANALQLLAKDKELRKKYANNAKKRANTLFSYKNFSESITKLINKVDADHE